VCCCSAFVDGGSDNSLLSHFTCGGSSCLILCRAVHVLDFFVLDLLSIVSEIGGQSP
jgi:hypothetical protein